jgi:hypothetical protein
VLSESKKWSALLAVWKGVEKVGQKYTVKNTAGKRWHDFCRRITLHGSA